MRSLELTICDDSNYFVREAFNTLRTNVLFCEKNVKSILVTSVQAHEGKTTVSLQLSKYLSLVNKKVLFIDADLRMSTIASRHTNAQDVVGLSHVLSGQVPVEEALYKTQFEQLDMILSGPYPPNPVELLSGETFKKLIQTMRENYDYVIVDAPPLGMVVDAAVIGEVCDGSLLVISSGVGKYRYAQSVKNQLESSGCKLLGAVLNQASKKSRIDSPQYRSYYYADKTQEKGKKKK